jgi:hypothetical protein
MIHLNNILHSTLRYFKWALPFRFSDWNAVWISHVSHSCYMLRPVQPPWFDYPNLLQIWGPPLGSHRRLIHCTRNYQRVVLIHPELQHLCGHFNSLTAWSRVLLEKLIVTQLVKIYPSCYRTQRFITVFTRTRHWSTSWARWIQSTTSRHISLRSILILSSIYA